MSQYRPLAAWLIQKDKIDVLLQIIHKSQYHITFGSNDHWLLVLMNQVTEHLSNGMRIDAGVPFGCVGNLAAFFFFFMFLGCPAIHDATVMSIMREQGLWEEFAAYMKSKNYF